MSESLAELRAMAAALRGLDQGVDDATRIDRIRPLEELKAAAAAAQAVETARFVDSQRRAQRAAGVKVERLFTTGQRRWVRLRDQACPTPWCEAPILPRRLRLHWRGDPHDTDHITAHEASGATSIGNAQGLCAACNHAKQAPGWHARPGPAGTVTTTTPTGHRYTGRPPRLPGSSRGSPIDRVVVDVTWHAA